MKQTFSVVVAGLPIAQPRQRHRVALRGRKPFVQNYTPATDPVQNYKRQIARRCKESWAGPLIVGPVSVELEFHFPRPGRLLKKSSPSGVIEHISRPDVENLAKAVLDALTGVVWRDDSQVFELHVCKFYAQAGAGTHTVIDLEWDYTELKGLWE